MAEPTKETAPEAAAEDISRPKRNPHVQMIIDHLWGPTGSAILHVLIIIALINLVVSPARLDKADIEVTVVEPEESKLEEFQKELEQLKDVEVDIQPPDAQMTTEQPQEVDTSTSTEPSEDLAAMDIDANTQSPLIMKGLFAARTSSGRAGALGAYNRRWGGATEAAVLKALEWLKKHQLEDGSWEGTGSAKNKPAMTGLALLCFLAHGETPASSERYGPTVDRAIKFLVKTQQADGLFDKGNSYANGIALYAISEAYALTRIPSLREVMEKGTAPVISGQQDTGAYTYGYAKNGRRDTSVAGWQAQALKAAFIAGADVPGLKESMAKCVNGFKMNYKPEGEGGRFKYAPQPGKPDGDNPTAACTAIGSLCMQLLGHGADKEVDGALKAMDEWTCNYNEPQGTGRPLYTWYYVTQTKFHKGKGTWERWNNSFAKEMVDHQNPDGSWVSGAKEEGEQGPVYGTTFGALTLMVYYRFLPTYKPVEAEAKPTEKSADDVVVEVI